MSGENGTITESVTPRQTLEKLEFLSGLRRDTQGEITSMRNFVSGNGHDATELAAVNTGVNRYTGELELLVRVVQLTGHRSHSRLTETARHHHRPEIGVGCEYYVLPGDYSFTGFREWAEAAIQEISIETQRYWAAEKAAAEEVLAAY